MPDQQKRQALGRPVGFDRETVLEIAMEFLWNGGFEETPVGDLIDAMGLSRSSFYAAFGSKRGVLIGALRLYSARCIELLVDINRRDDERRIKLRDMIFGLAVVGDERGCFMANCISGQARHDPEIRQIAAEHNAAVEHFLTNLLSDDGSGSRPARARVLISAAYGATLLRAAGTHRAEIEEMLDALVDRV
ncbi:HTH-type transcriptional repressor ComR [Rhodobacteraceae bacterium THAF1]|uniref:TetR/AcrR family transcriptional regulator n=1 Tax=Palleronia sp. THAF1 TaxID=2587842 RepID=UPI000F3B89FC|nr:TetR/AcrR family transcriptional regulator [Palleronia sp. THAF1]QFU07189.1 HTH-type transcriptional repressor ComR [Palleronia sp. THAF1]VDC16579.1 HTH-type transcriptional repressor ComR [Rhodobacteraceae bacterium THAF1]